MESFDCNGSVKNITYYLYLKYGKPQLILIEILKSKNLYLKFRNNDYITTNLEMVII
jgi:hypothetical protein